MSSPAYALELELELELEHTDTGTPEKAMWCAALALLLDDARRYHQGKRDTFGAVPGTGQRALRDLIERGPCVRHLCDMAGQDVEWVCERFARSLK